MDGGACWAAVRGVARSRTRLSDFTWTFRFHALEKEMATHSSDLAWRIPRTGKPGGLPSTGSHRVGHDWSDLAAATAAAFFYFFFFWNWKLKFVLGLDEGFPGSTAGKESACNVGDLSWLPGLGRFPGEGKGYPLQYSYLENSMD